MSSERELSEIEQLIREVSKLTYSVEGMINRVQEIEDHVAQIGSGLAVVLSRTEGTKKKLAALGPGYRRWLSVLIRDSAEMRNGLPG